MKELEKTIKDYIKTEQTNYAMLIKGPWGCGKTYFLKNQLFNVIKKNNQHPLYISLYGISEPEDLSKAVIFAMFPFLQNSAIKKLAKGIDAVSGALSAISIAGFSFDLGKIVKDFNISEWVNVKKTSVLCFDDLERTKLDIGQILGFINNFVEHDNIKTILIGNEDEIVKNQINDNYPEKVQAAALTLLSFQRDNNIKVDQMTERIEGLFGPRVSYFTIKEKVIGRTIEYKPDIEKIFDSIIFLYQQNRELKKFFKSNKQSIVKIFRKSGTQNIRALKGALDTFKVIFNPLRKIDKATRSMHELNMLLYILAIILEIKADERRKSEFKTMKRIDDYEIASLLWKKETPAPYIIEFYEKYFSEDTPKVNISGEVIRYIIDGFFDEDVFIKELQEEKEEIGDDVGKKLKAIHNFQQLDNISFNRTVRTVLQFISQGKIKLYQYPPLFETFYYFSQSKLIKEDIAQLKTLFVRGINTTSIKIKYEDIREARLIEPPVLNKRSEEYLEIKKAVEDRALKLQENYWSGKCLELLNLLPNSFAEFRSKYFDETEEFQVLPIFKYYPAPKLVKRIIKLHPADLFHFAQIMKRRYSDFNFTPKLREDCTNIEAFLTILDKHTTKAKKKSLRLHWLYVLSSELREACERIKLSNGAAS